MTEMIERVAKAMCDGKWDAKNIAETPGGEDPEDHREYWRDKARAAIEAMRELTELEKFSVSGFGTQVVNEVWVGVIDAALKEETEE